MIDTRFWFTMKQKLPFESWVGIDIFFTEKSCFFKTVLVGKQQPSQKRKVVHILLEYHNT